MIAMRVLIESSSLPKDSATMCFWKSLRGNSGKKKKREMSFGGKCDKERTCVEFVEMRMELNRIFSVSEEPYFRA